MSRWMEQYKKHVNTVSWPELKESLNKIELDDKSIQTDVEELTRLKKVVGFLDALIVSLDPELFPLATWNNFRTQCKAAGNLSDQFEKDRNIVHVQKINEHLDNLLTYVRPYMVAEGRAAIALKNAAVEASSQLKDGYVQLEQESKATYENIKTSKEEAKSHLTKITSIYERIEEFEKLIFGEKDKYGFEQKIKKLLSDTENAYEQVKAYYNVVFVGEEGGLPIKQQVETIKEEVCDDRDSISALLSGVREQIESLEEFHIMIFGENSSEDENKGLAGELDVRMEELHNFEEEQKKRYEALNKELNSLLPGATNAGLASAYHDMKISFDKPIRNASWLFYGSIIILVISSFLLSADGFGGDSWIKFTELSDWDSLLKSLIYKLPFYGPILWLAFYASKRRSEYQRLQQEYAHKEALAKSYQSYKQQIEALKDDNDEMLKGLLTKSIDTIAYNVSETLDKKHGDKMPIHEIVEKATNGVRNK